MRILDFSDGFSSAEAPTITHLPANQYQQFADDATFVTYKGSAASKSDVYFNTTSNVIRYHDGTTWQNVASETLVSSTSDTLETAIETVQDNLDAYETSNNAALADVVSDVSALETNKADQTALDAEVATLEGSISALDTDLDSHVNGLSAHGVTGNVLGTSDTQVVTNKDIDGGTASNSRRITLPQAPKATLDGLTRKEGTLLYGNDTDLLYIDNGSTLVPLSSSTTIAMRYASSGGGTIGVGNTLQTFATQTYNTHPSNWSGTTWTCPVAGKYFVTAGILSASVNITASQAFQLAIYKNGALYSIIARPNGLGTAQYKFTGSDTLTCASSDTISIYTSCSVATSQDPSTTYNFVSIYWIGA